MVKKVAVITVLVVFLMGGVLATGANAGLGPPCDSIDSNFQASVSPTTGAAGDPISVSVSGTMGLSQVLAYWMEESNQIAFFTTDASGNGSAAGNIPADAVPGSYYLRFAAMDDTEHEINCYIDVTVVSGEQTFTETPASGGGTTVQQDAYSQAARTTMPSTGAWLLPAAGLMGAGVLLVMKKRS